MALKKRVIFEWMNPLPPDANGYCYYHNEHFDTCIFSASKHLISSHGGLLDRIPYLGFIVIIVPNILWPAFSFLGLNVWLIIILEIPLLIIFFLYLSRVRRFARRIIKEQLCFKCGYSLEHTPTDEDGSGKCSECGQPFHTAYYLRLPSNYIRLPSKEKD